MTDHLVPIFRWWGNIPSISPLWKESDMPYKSKAQSRFLHAKHPEIAKKWDEEGYSTKGLPKKKKKKKGKKK